MKEHGPYRFSWSGVVVEGGDGVCVVGGGGGGETGDI